MNPRPDPLFHWHARDLAIIAGPVVYAVYVGEQPWYIGVSSRGLQRVFGQHHHVLTGFWGPYGKLRDKATVTVWAFENLGDAKRFEADLIGELRPEKNVDIPQFRAKSRKRPKVLVGFRDFRRVYHYYPCNKPSCAECRRMSRDSIGAREYSNV